MTAFWNWLTTSRYTRLLESENARLLVENATLKASNQRLMAAVMPTLKAAITGVEPAVVAKTMCQSDVQPLKPKRIGWSAIKSAAERDYPAEKAAETVEKNTEAASA